MPASQHVMFGIWTGSRRELVAIGNRQGIGRRGSSGFARRFFFTARALRGAFFGGLSFTANSRCRSQREAEVAHLRRPARDHRRAESPEW